MAHQQNPGVLVTDPLIVARSVTPLGRGNPLGLDRDFDREPSVRAHAAKHTPWISKVRLCANDGGGPNGIRTRVFGELRKRAGA
jgi:hypothetical protein